MDDRVIINEYILLLDDTLVYIYIYIFIYNSLDVAWDVLDGRIVIGMGHIV